MAKNFIVMNKYKNEREREINKRTTKKIKSWIILFDSFILICSLMAILQKHYYQCLIFFIGIYIIWGIIFLFLFFLISHRLSKDQTDMMIIKHTYIRKHGLIFVFLFSCSHLDIDSKRWSTGKKSRMDNKKKIGSIVLIWEE